MPKTKPKPKPVKQTTQTKPVEQKPAAPEPVETITRTPRPRQLNLPEGVITSVQAAERIGCSKEYIVKVARSGQLKCWRIGKHYRFKVSDVDAFKQRSQTTSEPNPQD